jgi:large subunit ribosomal protein L30
MAKKNLENKLLAVVRVRGRARVRKSITETLNRLNLKRVNNLVILFGNKSNLGMISKSVDFITFGEINGEVLSSLLKKQGVEAKQDTIDDLMNGRKSVKDLKIELPVRMHPPKHGYTGIKLGHSIGGALGYRGESINQLIKRMM